MKRRVSSKYLVIINITLNFQLRDLEVELNINHSKFLYFTYNEKVPKND
uniref:Uncharacterized protein n=1 Tax=Lepeophtheirus salmonis TaxID=72036 RepID=A0A0K2TAS0_LEPSM